MRCSKAERYISDHVDGLLDAPRAEKLMVHLESCAACRDLHAYMRSIIVEAKQLDTILIERDLWPSIQSRLREKERGGASGRHTLKRLFSGFSLYPRGLAFSASAFLAGIMIMSLIYYGMPYLQRNVPISGKIASNQYKKVEFHYQQAIDALNKAISEQDVELPPELAAVFKENLEIIDNSILAFKAAVDKHPDDPDATEYLMICYQKKLELLGEMKDLMMQSS